MILSLFFMCLLAICITSLEKSLFFFSLLLYWVAFFLLLLSCMSYFYILEIKPLLVISFANIFSPSVGCLFVLLMVSFAVWKLLNWVMCLLMFAFISLALGDRLQKILVQFTSNIILPMFSSRSFMFSDLTSRSLIHFLVYFYILY